MTRQDAIDILVGVIATNSEEENEALDMAIEALEQEPKPSDVARDIATIIENEQDMRVIALQQEPKWIPVSERLPKTKGTYLVTVPQIDGASEFIYISVWTGNEWIPSNRILAWMPLPEPYEESDTE